MYILIDSFTNLSLPLQNTLAEIKEECTYVVLKSEDRFLPVGFISLFDFIIDCFSPLPDAFHDVPLPCVKIPSYYSVTSDTNRRGYIRHLGKIKGTIWFRHDYPVICADRVERLDENDKIVRIDFYNRYGFISFSDFYSDNTEAISRTYYSADNKPLLNYSYDTDTYCLLQDGHVVLTFAGKDELTSYCMSLIHSTGKRIIPTSMMQINLLWQKNLLDKQADILLFQSAEEYLQFLKSPALHRESHHIILMNNESSKMYVAAISEPTFMIRYANRKQRILPTDQHALTLTWSDQVEGLAEFAQANPHITFHIAATTMVSQTLLSYERYENVKIYPSISSAKLHELFLISSFYLDINRNEEVYDAIVSASNIPLLLMGFEDTLHNPDYLLPECMFSKGDHHSFARALYVLSTDLALYSNYLNRQSEENFKTLIILKSLLSEGEKQL